MRRVLNPVTPECTHGEPDHVGGRRMARVRNVHNAEFPGGAIRGQLAPQE